MEENLLWIIFFVIVAILRGVGWLMRQLKGPQQAPRPGQRGPAGRPTPPARPPGPAGAKETPFQSMLRMLEEASEAGQQQQQRRQAPPQPRPQPRPRPKKSVPVARAVTQAQPRAAVLPKAHGGNLSARRLKTNIASRHVKSAVATRHMAHLSHPGHQGRDHDEHGTAEGPTGFWNALNRLTPIQSAVVMGDVLGPARHSRNGTPYGLDK